MFGQSKMEEKDRTKQRQDKIKYQGTNLKVVEIPTIMGISDAWDAIEELLATGYTIKGVIEREQLKTSWVLLEKSK